MSKHSAIPKGLPLAQKLAASLDKDQLHDMWRRMACDKDGQPYPFYAWKPYVVTRDGSPYRGVSPQAECLLSRARTKIFGGSNRVGKSTLVVHQAIAWGMGFDPATQIQYPDVKNEVVWVATEPDNIEPLFDKLIQHAPPNEIYEPRRGSGRQMIRFRRTNLVIRMKSFAQPRSQYESEKCYALISDEELPEHLYMAARTRLIDTWGTMLFSVTPVLGSAYLHELMGKQEEKFHRADEGRCAWWMVPMRDNPYLSPEAIDEYEDEFRGDEDELAIRVHGEYRLMLGKSVFPRETLQRLGNATVEPEAWIVLNEDGEPDEGEKGDGWAVWKRPVPGNGYVLSADPAEGGEKRDNSVAYVLEATTGIVCAEYCSNGAPIAEFAEELFRGGLYYNRALLGPEMNNSVGGALLTMLQEKGYPNMYQRRSYTGRMDPLLGTFGWKTDAFSKRVLVEDFQKALADGAVTIYSGPLVNEMRSFVRHKRRIPGTHGFGASGRDKDDRVMAVMIGWQLLKAQQMYVDSTPEARYRNVGKLAREYAYKRHNEQFEDEYLLEW